MAPAYEPRFRAVFFDFGGVLTTSVWDSFADFCRGEGLDPDTVKKLFSTDPGALRELRQLELGEITEDEFERAFGRRLGLKDPVHLIDSMFAGMQPDTLMVGAVKDLRAVGVLTGLISNSWSTAHYDRRLLAELFDTAVISGEVYMHKPEPEIYRLAAERLGVEPAHCIFVDDLRENCEGAEAVGMTAVRHRDAPETIARLAELTGVSLAAPA
ncbi:MAG TPA: HAD family phosphatase [Solirubrobacterales bacterium]|nr:HAD family phosphatase [Solirubrobacterales bacterium]